MLQGKHPKEASLEDDLETTQPSKKSKKGKYDGNVEKSSKNYQSTLKGSDHFVELASPSLKARSLVGFSNILLLRRLKKRNW